MAGDNDDLDLDGGDAQGAGTPKKASGLAALLPNLLKFIAIGLGAIVFIVTISVITYNILNKGGKSQTAIPSNSPFVGARPQYQFFTSIGMVRTSTKDPVSYSVVVDMVIGYDLNDNAAQSELIGRLYELRDFVRLYFKSKMADELRPENEARIKQEILEMLNTRVLNSAKVRIILFNQLDVMSMQ
jgi:flagellar FliL protein